MSEVKMKAGKRVNITACPDATTLAEALAGLRAAGLTLERNVQIVLAGAWFEYHSTEGPERFRTIDSIRTCGLTSGLAQSTERALCAINRHKPESGTATKSEAVKFAIEQAANIFSHQTRERTERREKARAKAEEKKAERAKIDAELAAAKKALAETEREDGPVEEVSMPSCAIVGEAGEILLQLTPEEIHFAVDLVRRAMLAEKGKLSVCK